MPTCWSSSAAPAATCSPRATRPRWTPRPIVVSPDAELTGHAGRIDAHLGIGPAQFVSALPAGDQVRGTRGATWMDTLRQEQLDFTRPRGRRRHRRRLGAGLRIPGGRPGRRPDHHLRRRQRHAVGPPLPQPPRPEVAGRTAQRRHGALRSGRGRGKHHAPGPPRGGDLRGRRLLHERPGTCRLLCPRRDPAGHRGGQRHLRHHRRPPAPALPAAPLRHVDEQPRLREVDRVLRRPRRIRRRHRGLRPGTRAGPGQRPAGRAAPEDRPLHHGPGHRGAPCAEVSA